MSEININKEPDPNNDKKIIGFQSPIKKEANKIKCQSPEVRKKINFQNLSGKKGINLNFNKIKSFKTLKTLNAIKINNSFTKDSLIFEVLKITSIKNYDRIANEFKKFKQNYKSKNKLSLFTSNQIKTRNEESSFFEMIKTKSANVHDVINRLIIPQEERSVEDTLIIRKYLKSTNYERLFNIELNRKGDLCNKLLIFLSLEMKYKKCSKNENLFKIGDDPDFFYLILEGHVDILKPVSKIQCITGFEFFSHLMDYKKNNEIHLFNLCVKENKNNFIIKYKDADLIQYIYLIYQLENIQNSYIIDFAKILNFLNINPDDLGLDSNKINSNEYICKKGKLIKSKIPFISDDDLKYYRFLEDKIDKKEILLFEYQSYFTLGPGTYFGESFLGDKKKRSGIAHVAENCSLGYVDRDFYDSTFYNERKTIINKKVYFLYNNFFFNKIAFKRFLNNYFAWFISSNYYNRNIIYNEGQQASFVYFIESGLIELSSSKTILEIQTLLNELKEKRKMKKDDSNEIIYTDIKRRINELQNHITKEQKNKVIFLGKDEIMGLESFYYNIPYLTNAKVISPKVVVHKIDVEHLSQILLREKECASFLRNSVNQKIDILTTRFSELNNIKLKLIDEKIMHNEKILYDKYIKEKQQLKNSTIVKKNDQNNNDSEINNNSKLLSLIKENYNVNHKINSYKDETKHSRKREIKKKIKKRNFATFLYDFEKSNKCNSCSQRKLSSLNSDKLNLLTKEEKLSSPIIENKMLKQLKLQIKLLENDKYFFSNIKIDEKEKTNNKIEDTDSKADVSTQNDFIKNNKKRNSQPKKDESIFFTQLEDIKTKMNTLDSIESSRKMNKLNNYEGIGNKKISIHNILNLPSLHMSKLSRNQNLNFLVFNTKVERQNKNTFSADNSLERSKFNTINEKIKFYNNSSTPNLLEYVKKNKYYSESALINKMEKYKIFNESDNYLENIKEKEEKNKKLNNLKGLNQFGFPLNDNKSFFPKYNLKFNKNAFNIKIKKYKDYKKEIAKKMEEIKG